MEIPPIQEAKKPPRVCILCIGRNQGEEEILKLYTWLEDLDPDTDGEFSAFICDGCAVNYWAVEVKEKEEK